MARRLSRLRRTKAGKRQQKLTTATSTASPTSSIGLRGIRQSATQQARTAASRLGKTKTQLSQSDLNRTRNQIRGAVGPKRQALINQAAAGQDITSRLGRAAQDRTRTAFQQASKGATTGQTGPIGRARTATGLLPPEVQAKIDLQRGGQDAITRLRGQQSAQLAGLTRESDVDRIRKQREALASSDPTRINTQQQRDALRSFTRSGGSVADFNARLEAQKQQQLAALEQQEAAALEGLQRTSTELGKFGRPSPTVPTPDSPIASIGGREGEVSDLGDLSAREQLIKLKADLKEKGSVSTEDRIKLDRLQQQVNQEQTATLFPGQQPQVGADGLVTDAQAALDERFPGGLTEGQQEGLSAVEKEQKLERDRLLGQDLRAASKIKEQVQEAASARGVGRSTYVLDRNDEIDAELSRTFERRREIDQIQRSKLKAGFLLQNEEARAAAESQLIELQDEQATAEQQRLQDIAKFNFAQQATADEAIENMIAGIESTGGSTEKVDWTGSKLLGKLVDDFGRPILDKDGREQPLGTDAPGATKKDWIKGKTTNGAEFWWNSENPEERVYADGEGKNYFKDTSGSPITSRTTRTDNAVIVGPEEQPELYEKNLIYEDGTRYSLAENCVKFAREIAGGTIDNTFGLFTVEDKQRAIDEVGNTDPDTFNPGDVILTSEGKWGHAAVIQSIDENGNLVLLESNYSPSAVSQGRTISPNDPKVMGALPGQQQLFGDFEIGDRDAEGNNIAPGEEAQNEFDLDAESKIMLKQIQQGRITPTEISKVREELFSNAKTPEEKQFIADKLSRAMDSAVQINQDAETREIIAQSAGNKKLLSQGEREEFTKALTVMDQIGSLRDVMQDAIDEGKMGPIAGKAAGFNPYDKEAAVVRAQLKALVPNLARGIYGEVGVLTDTDIDNYIRTLPNMSSTEDQANALLAMTVDVVRGGVERKLKLSASTGQNVSNLGWILDDLNTFSKSLEGGFVPAGTESTQQVIENIPTTTAELTDEFIDSLIFGDQEPKITSNEPTAAEIAAGQSLIDR